MDFPSFMVGTLGRLLDVDDRLASLRRDLLWESGPRQVWEFVFLDVGFFGLMVYSVGEGVLFHGGR